SALTAISSETLTRLRVREREALREEGHLEAAAIVAYARQRFEENADNPARISKIKDQIRKRIEILERNQHRRSVTIETTKLANDHPKPDDEDTPGADKDPPSAAAHGRQP